MSAAWPRIHALLLILVLLALLAVVGLLATGVRGGPLDPPGAPGATDSVRLPGTPIAALPFDITQPGTYYLTRNLTATGPYNGITVQPGIDGVTIDLMGFTLDGNRGSVASNYGIVVTASQGSVTRNLAIRNGTIRNWGLSGVAANNAVFSRFEDLTVAGNGGVGLHAGSASIVQRVIAYENTSDGIRLVQIGPYGGGNVLQSLATHNGGDGIEIDAAQVIVDGNTFNSNGQYAGGAGIRIAADDNQIRNNETVWNAYGIYIEPGDHHTDLSRNRASHNLLEDCHDLGFHAVDSHPYPNEWGARWRWVDYFFTYYGSGIDWTSPFDAMLNFCATKNPPPPNAPQATPNFAQPAR